MSTRENIRLIARAPYPNHQEWINVRIQSDSWRIVNFSTYSVMFYDSDTK